MTTLKTPSEVAAFLAERVMGWSDHIISTPTGQKSVRHFDAHDELVTWDPWRNVAHAIEALEAWQKVRDTHSRSWRVHAWEPDEYGMELLRARGWAAIETTDGEGRSLSIAACSALCAALGATVEIDE